jgi:hypothetical protein
MTWNQWAGTADARNFRVRISHGTCRPVTHPGPPPQGADRPTLFDRRSRGLFCPPLPPGEGRGEGRLRSGDLARALDLGPSAMRRPSPPALSRRERGERPRNPRPHPERQRLPWRPPGDVTPRIGSSRTGNFASALQFLAGRMDGPRCRPDGRDLRPRRPNKFAKSRFQRPFPAPIRPGTGRANGDFRSPRPRVLRDRRGAGRSPQCHAPGLTTSNGPGRDRIDPRPSPGRPP